MRIFITRRIPEAGRQPLLEAGHKLIEHDALRELSPAELIEGCRGADALISSGPNRLDAAFFKACPQLKAITLLSAGFDNVDVDAANRAGMPVGHTPEVLNESAADVAFLLMLAVSRNAFGNYERIRRGEWNFFQPTVNLGVSLEGKTLGIFGLGKIGRTLARKCAAAFGMKVIYHNRRRSAEAEGELNAAYVSFKELLSQSDVLSLHANLSSENRGLFDKSAFSKMKPTAIFINTARGAMHNEPDLIAALRQGILWGAGLDVTNPEPMAPDNPLLSMRNVCVLPHIGSATRETRDAMAELAARNILAGLKGERMPKVINPEVYRA